MPLRHCRRAFVFLFASCIAFSLPSQVGEAGYEQRAEAAALIPLRGMNSEAQQKLTPILEHPTLFRRLPAQTVDCDPEMFTFIARQPEVLVSIWEAMGITKVQTQRLGPFLLKGIDAAGTACELELIYGTPNLHVYYATGKYDGTLAPQGITGRGVFVLHSSQTTTQHGRPMVHCNLDVFMQLDNLGADLLARTIQPLLWGTAEQNFVESAKYVSQISQAAELNSEGIQNLAYRLPSLSPSVRDQFILQVQRVAARADQRWTLSSKSPASKAAAAKP